MPVISDVRHPLMYYDTATMSLLLWDGSLQAGGLVIGHVIVDSGTVVVTNNGDVPFKTQIQDGSGVGVASLTGTSLNVYVSGGGDLATTTLQSAGNNSLASIDATLGASYIGSLESDANHNPLYVGLAVKGTTTAQALWQIRKFTSDANNNVSTWRYANASAAFNAVWDNRASLSYS